MKVLLDTHSLIWFFSGHPNLSNRGRQIMDDVNHQKLISLASVWEMGIKQSKGKLSLSLPLEDYINDKIKLEDFDLLPIKLNHLALISTLPFHHNDPFDRPKEIFSCETSIYSGENHSSYILLPIIPSS